MLVTDQWLAAVRPRCRVLRAVRARSASKRSSPSFEFAAGKLPAAGHVLARRSLCDQHAGLLIEHGAGEDVSWRTLGNHGYRRSEAVGLTLGTEVASPVHRDEYMQSADGPPCRLCRASCRHLCDSLDLAKSAARDGVGLASAFLRQRAVAMLVLLARAARTGFVASHLLRRHARIAIPAQIIGRQRLGTG